MRKKWYLPIILSILMVLLGGYGFYLIKGKWDADQIVVKNPPINKVDKSAQLLDFKSIVHEAEKNVLLIEGKNDDYTMTGSGFLYNDKGDIITNAHVIKDADIIYVRTANAHVYPAAVVGMSEETDIAVIRVPQLVQESFLSVERDLIPEIGDEIIALGSPHGFQNTVTLGIISGTERNFSVDEFDYNNVYQISAQITHGNSGGPLIDRTTGNVIGVNSVGTEDGTIGFSIPISEVLEQVEQWSDNISVEELEYANMSDVLTKYDPEQIHEDATYLIEYFYDNLQMREYIDAYTLLGSQMQSELSYADFRETYTQIVNLEYEENSFEMTENNHSKSTIDVTFETKSSDNDENIKDKITYTFIIGLENDQLKILKLTES